MRSLTFLAVSLRKNVLGQGRRCPSCGGANGNAVVDRKWAVTTLRRCGDCRLLFRVPTTTGEENEKIYQSEYCEGSTTDLPDNETLRRWVAAHVMEHVPSVRETLALADRVLRPGGFFVAFTPNGSDERRRRDPAGWHQQWGFVHPQLLDREWIETVGRMRPVLAATSPYDLEALSAGRSPADYSGAELLVVLRKPSGR